MKTKIVLLMLLLSFLPRLQGSTSSQRVPTKIFYRLGDPLPRLIPGALLVVDMSYLQFEKLEAKGLLRSHVTKVSSLSPEWTKFLHKLMVGPMLVAGLNCCSAALRNATSINMDASFTALQQACAWGNNVTLAQPQILIFPVTYAREAAKLLCVSGLVCHFGFPRVEAVFRHFADPLIAKTTGARIKVGFIVGVKGKKFLRRLRAITRDIP